MSSILSPPSSVDMAEPIPTFAANKVVLELDIEELSSEDSEPTFSRPVRPTILPFETQVVVDDAAELDIVDTLFVRLLDTHVDPVSVVTSKFWFSIFAEGSKLKLTLSRVSLVRVHLVSVSDILLESDMFTT